MSKELNKKENNKVYGYVRVSTPSQVQFGFGLDIQLDSIKKYCEYNNLILEKVFFDRGISGATTDRAGLNDLISNLETTDIKKVVVFSTSRLWRETTIQAIITKDLKKIGADIISIENPKFSIYSEGTDKLLNTIMTALDDYERYQIAKKLNKGRRTKAKQGDKACGTAPFGYKWDNRVIIIEESEAEIVKLIYKTYQEKQSLGKVKKVLDMQEIKTRGGKSFSRQAIQNILTNDFYIGEVKFDDIKKRGNHQVFISKHLFTKVKNIMNLKAKS